MIPILFSEEDRLGGDDELAKALRDNPTVIAQVGTSQIDRNAVPRGVAKIGNPLPFLFEWEGMLGPIQKLGQSADGVGVINTAPEIDGVVRRIPLIMKIERVLGYSEGELSRTIEEETYPTMAVEVIRVATGNPSYQVKAGEGGVQAIRVPGFPIINTDPNARIWLHWNKEFETISASESDFSKFEGRTVIIGTTAEGLGGIIATPIGNLEDITLRALRILKEVDLILAEDTRIGKKLLNHYRITTHLESFHMYNEHQKAPKVVQRLRQGTTIAVITDAGTPAISDPAYKFCLLYTSPSPRDATLSRMPSSA